jgi:hypothetical protein
MGLGRQGLGYSFKYGYNAKEWSAIEGMTGKFK